MTSAFKTLHQLLDHFKMKRLAASIWNISGGQVSPFARIVAAR